MYLDTGLSGRGHALASWPGVNGTNANASPQGPATAAEAGFGVSAGGDGISGETCLTLAVGTGAVAFLFWIWWALPR